MSVEVRPITIPLMEMVAGSGSIMNFSELCMLAKETFSYCLNKSVYNCDQIIIKVVLTF